MYVTSDLIVKPRVNANAIGINANASDPTSMLWEIHSLVSTSS